MYNITVTSIQQNVRDFSIIILTKHRKKKPKTMEFKITVIECKNRVGEKNSTLRRGQRKKKKKKD